MGTEMKVIVINVCFKLPDDFDGSINDAIRALADYRDSKGYHELDPTGDNTFNNAEKIIISKNSNMMWPIFLKKVKDGFKLVGAIAISK